MREIKEKQESGSQSAEKKLKCPNCGHTMFSRTLVEPVEIVETRAMVTDAIADEPGLVNEFYCCVKCGSILDFNRVVAENAQVNYQDTSNSATTTYNELARYTACVFEPMDIVEVRRLPSGKSTWHLASELAEAVESLFYDNQHGQHVHVGVNPRHCRGGTRSNDVFCARCLFVDFDGINADSAKDRWQNVGLPTPTITIASGHGVHAYWRLAEAITDIALWSALQKRLIALLCSYSAIHDPARIMRLPGFINHKRPVAACQIIDDDRAQIYDLNFLMPLLYSVITESDYTAQYQAGCKNTGKLKKLFHSNTSAVNVAKLTADKWPGVTEGQRNCKAFQRAAFLVKNLALSEKQAWAILRKWNHKNTPPLPERELSRTLRNASVYGRHPAGNKITS